MTKLNEENILNARVTNMAVKGTIFDLYFENTCYWQAVSGEIYYGMNQQTLSDQFSTWFQMVIMKERGFLSDLRKLIISIEDGYLVGLKSILEQANKLIDEMDAIAEYSFIGEKESNYCRRHLQSIKKIVDIITNKEG